jgi:hypothetical protein
MTERPPDFDLSIGARMKKVRFNAVPPTRVRWGGAPGFGGETEEERENLPDELDAGVTYRDAAVRWRAGGWVGIDTEIKET